MTMHRSSLRRSLWKAAILPALATFAAAGCQKEDTLPMMMMGPPGGMSPMTMTPPGGMSPMAPPTSSPPPAGAANVKFCNAINGPNGPLKVSLSLGNLKLEAMSGTCAPDAGCQSMSAGNARLAFTMDSKEVFAQDIGIESGQQYLVVATVDRASQKVKLAGGKLPPQTACASANPFPMGSQPTDPGGPGPNQAVGKFCHGLSVQGISDLELELVIGSVSMKARTGGCSVPAGDACTSLPVGNQVAQLLLDGNVQASRNVMIEGGRQYLFDLDVEANRPVINAEALPAGVACTAAGGGSSPPPQPPPPPGSTTEVKLCNRLPAGSGTAALTIGTGGLTLTAAPGQCAPMRGTMCPMVPAGPTQLELSIDGNPLGMGSAPLPAGAVSLNLRPNMGAVGVQVQTIPAGMMCSAFEAN